MRALEHATLSDHEREVLDAFLARVRDGIENPVHEVWLFGSRARGERPGPLSDIDLLVIADRRGFADSGPVYDALHAAARDTGHPEVAWTFSIHVNDPAWLARRRAVRSPFVEAVERDRITVLAT